MSIDPKSKHYDAGGISFIDIVEAKLTPDQFLGFLLGNIIKYTCRANHKGEFNRDMEKADVYREIMQERLKVRD